MSINEFSNTQSHMVEITYMELVDNTSTEQYIRNYDWIWRRKDMLISKFNSTLHLTLCPTKGVQLASLIRTLSEFYVFLLTHAGLNISARSETS